MLGKPIHDNTVNAPKFALGDIDYSALKTWSAIKLENVMVLRMNIWSVATAS